MSELVAALDLEANEWGQRLGKSDSSEFDGSNGREAQARESELLDVRLPGWRAGQRWIEFPHLTPSPL